MFYRGINSSGIKIWHPYRSLTGLFDLSVFISYSLNWRKTVFGFHLQKLTSQIKKRSAFYFQKCRWLWLFGLCRNCKLPLKRAEQMSVLLWFFIPNNILLKLLVCLSRWSTSYALFPSLIFISNAWSHGSCVFVHSFSSHKVLLWNNADISVTNKSLFLLFLMILVILMNNS